MEIIQMFEQYLLNILTKKKCFVYSLMLIFTLSSQLIKWNSLDLRRKAASEKAERHGMLSQKAA